MAKPKYRVVKKVEYTQIRYIVQTRFLWLFWVDQGIADFGNFEDAAREASRLQEFHDSVKRGPVAWYPPVVNYKESTTSHGGLTVVSGEIERDGEETR